MENKKSIALWTSHSHFCNFPTATSSIPIILCCTKGQLWFLKPIVLWENCILHALMLVCIKSSRFYYTRKLLSEMKFHCNRHKTLKINACLVIESFLRCPHLYSFSLYLLALFDTLLWIQMYPVSCPVCALYNKIIDALITRVIKITLLLLLLKLYS